jgi:hypothetical protein
MMTGRKLFIANLIPSYIGAAVGLYSFLMSTPAPGTCSAASRLETTDKKSGE